MNSNEWRWLEVATRGGERIELKKLMRRGREVDDESWELFWKKIRMTGIPSSASERSWWRGDRSQRREKSYEVGSGGRIVGSKWRRVKRDYLATTCKAPLLSFVTHQSIRLDYSDLDFPELWLQLPIRDLFHQPSTFFQRFGRDVLQGDDYLLERLHPDTFYS